MSSALLTLRKHIHGPTGMRRLIGLGITACIGQIPAGIDHPKIGILKMRAKPRCGHECFGIIGEGQGRLLSAVLRTNPKGQFSQDVMKHAAADQRGLPPRSNVYVFIMPFRTPTITSGRLRRPRPTPTS